ncbi:MAG: S41 family peptidase [Treponema sp.]|nr:S41 family peptidase [Treponema sp.]
MNKFKIIIFYLIFSLSACQFFWTEDHDASPLGIFNSLWTGFDEMYALFEAREIDWDEAREQFLPLISPDMSNMELFWVCARMLNTLQDPHVTLITPFGTSYVLIPVVPSNDVFFMNEIRNEYLIDRGKTAGNGRIIYGTINPEKTSKNIGYIHFADFQIENNLNDSWVNDIETIIKYFSHTDFLVLDIRNSYGGLGLNMEYIASRFVLEEKDYKKVSTKNGPGRNDFSNPVVLTIRPAGTRYTKPIVLLTNNETVSAAEWFTLALRTQRHVTHAGEQTKGALSSMVTRTLVNGWKYTLSIQKTTDINGINYEGKGISPNAEHRLNNIDTNQEIGSDRQLEYALTLY